MEVTKTIVKSLHGSDFVVVAFQFSVGDGVLGGVEDS
jgi:hypothetical protein